MRRADLLKRGADTRQSWCPLVLAIMARGVSVRVDAHAMGRFDTDMTKRHPLGELIAQVKMANGWSDVDIARRATAAGYPMSKSNISRICTHPVKNVVPTQVRGLAAGLGISASQIALTTLSSMGIHVTSEPNSVEDAVRRDILLSERDKKNLLALLGTMHANRKSDGV